MRKVVAVTLVSVACGSSKEPLHVNPPPQDPVVEPTPAPAPPTPTVGLRTLNATQGEQTVFRDQSGCYVNVFKAPPNPALSFQPPDHEKVDCPPTMTDASWDACLGGTVSTTADPATCVCAVLGNPPPPPREIACPKTGS